MQGVRRDRVATLSHRSRLSDAISGVCPCSFSRCLRRVFEKTESRLPRGLGKAKWRHVTHLCSKVTYPNFVARREVFRPCVVRSRPAGAVSTRVQGQPCCATSHRALTSAQIFAGERGYRDQMLPTGLSVPVHPRYRAPPGPTCFLARKCHGAKTEKPPTSLRTLWRSFVPLIQLVGRREKLGSSAPARTLRRRVAYALPGVNTTTAHVPTLPGHLCVAAVLERPRNRFKEGFGGVVMFHPCGAEI